MRLLPMCAFTASSRVKFTFHLLLTLLSLLYYTTTTTTTIFRPHYGPEVDSASNRNEYQEYFLGAKAAGA